MCYIFSLLEWKADYRPSPAQSSEEHVEDHNYSLSGCQVYSMNTLAADNPPRGTTRGGKTSRLTPCRLMDFPVLIDAISMGLPILYFKGSQVEVSKL